MSKIIDIDELRAKKEQKSKAEKQRKDKNRKAINKMKRVDRGVKIKPYQFYLGLLIIVALLVLVKGVLI